jgi:hypothetical protein
MKSTFNRDYDNTLDLFNTQNGFIEKMMDDVIRGEAFIAFRPQKKMTVYMKGRKLCEINSPMNTPIIDSKCLPILKSGSSKKQITEQEWKKKTGVLDFSWKDIYPEIKDNLYLELSPEAKLVSGLYKFSPMVDSNDSNIILLDIEAKFSYSKGVDKKQDLRIDVVLYNTITRQLAFVEVKRLNDERLQKDGVLSEEIKNQLASYKKLINDESNEIIREFNKTIEAYSSIYQKKIEPIDKDKILLSLLVTEFKEEDKKIIDSLSKQIQDSNLRNISFLSRGKIADATQGTLKKWFSEMQ